MKFKSAFVAFILILSVYSCKTGQEEKESGVQYYRHIQFSETPYDQLKGVYPLTDKQAAEINHYRFTYNEDGSLAEVSYKRGDEVLGYSSMGAATVKVEYSPGKEVYSYFDKDGNQQKNRGAWLAVYELDENGNRAGLHYEDLEGNKMANWNDIAYYVWKVTPDDMIQEKRYTMDGEETVLNQFCPFYELRFSYDDNGYAVRMANYMDDTLYDCTVENCGDVGVSYFLFENDDNGALTKFSVHNSVGQLSNLYWGWAKFENKLDENGYVLERVSYDQDDELLSGKSTAINVQVYDAHGAVIERKFLDDHRNLLENNNGAAIIKYTYDQKGHPVDTTYFNAAEEEITAG